MTVTDVPEEAEMWVAMVSDRMLLSSIQVWSALGQTEPTTPEPSGAPDLSADPSNAGLPGAEFFAKFLGWGRWLALLACVGAIVAGGAMYGWSEVGQGGMHGGAKGKRLVVGGIVGVVAVGLAPQVVSGLFSQAQ